MVNEFEKEQRLLEHLEYVTQNSVTDSEGGKIVYNVYECLYCDDHVHTDKKRFTKAQIESYGEWGYPVEQHLQRKHNIEF